MSGIHTTQWSFSEGIFSGFDLRIFPSSPLLSKSSQISLCRTQDSRVSKLFQKGRVEFCVMKSHIRKQSLSKFLSSYYLRIFPFSPWAPRGFLISLCRIHDNCVSKLFQEGKGGTLCDEVTYQKAISQKASL